MAANRERVFGLALAAVLVVGGALTGGWHWSPWSMVVGPAYDVGAVPNAHLDRASWRREVLSKAYPRLVHYLREHESLTVKWVAESKVPRDQLVWLTAEGSLVVATSAWTPSKSVGAGSPGAQSQVVLTDRNLDGVLDEIATVSPDGRVERAARPTDEGSLLMWETALATTFRFSDCCRR